MDGPVNELVPNSRPRSALYVKNISVYLHQANSYLVSSIISKMYSELSIYIVTHNG